MTGVFPTKEETKMQAIAEAFSQGGGWMYVIAFTSVIGLGIMVERFIFLFFKFYRTFFNLIGKSNITFIHLSCFINVETINRQNN